MKISWNKIEQIRKEKKPSSNQGFIHFPLVSDDFKETRNRAVQKWRRRRWFLSNNERGLRIINEP